MIAASYPIEGGDFDRAGSASRGLKEQLKKVGVEAEIMRRIMIAAYEAEMNVVIHASRGTLWAGLEDGHLDLEVVDEGPGIADMERAMLAGYSTAGQTARDLGFGAGMGLPNIRRASDRFSIDSQPGRGTRVRSTIFLRPARLEDSLSNSLRVVAGRCKGCLACLKACPVGAIRVRERRPEILPSCIDCTSCIAACPTGALALRDPGRGRPLPVEARAATLVLPLAFLTAFGEALPPEALLAAVRVLGFRAVRFTEEWEAALRAEAPHTASEAAGKPLLLPLCPPLVNLVCAHFPSLIGNLAPLLSPVEAVRDSFRLEPVTVVPACPGQQSLLEADSRPGRLRLLAPESLLRLLLPLLEHRRARSGAGAEGAPGPAWVGGASGRGGLPAAPPGHPRTLRAEGMPHVLRVLEKAEKGLLGDIEVLELTACTRGCFGSPLFPEDPFVAEARHSYSQAPHPSPAGGIEAAALHRGEPLRPRRGTRLDDDMARAVEKLARIDALTRRLPGRDCGACGAPTCAALAEDIVLGRCGGDACIVPGTGEEEAR